MRSILKSKRLFKPSPPPCCRFCLIVLQIKRIHECKRQLLSVQLQHVLCRFGLTYASLSFLHAASCLPICVLVDQAHPRAQAPAAQLAGHHPPLFSDAVLSLALLALCAFVNKAHI
jgi:hypothetical protein